MDSEELKCCPFCGSYNRKLIVREHPLSKDFHVVCNVCGGHSGMTGCGRYNQVYGKDCARARAEAVRKWNMRAEDRYGRQ